MSYFGVKKINENVHFAGGLPNITKKTYLNLWKEAKNRNYTDFYKTLDDDFDVNIMKSKEELDAIALNTQITIKKVSKMLYLHGFVLYAALRKYIKDNPNIQHINIVETGTARGFSALCMAKALDDCNKSGTVYTIDILPNNVSMYWNCICDFDGRNTRPGLLKPWKSIVDKYIVFKTGDTKKLLQSLKLDRIHFSFLDARHNYPYLSYEMNWVKKYQQKGDIIICDDYTIYNDGRLQFPGITRAIDEFISKKEYDHKIYWGDDGMKKRGYVWFKQL
tara:strand:- start:687 stop:1517 length:831 start_codon:yes stop_codon:yes gene_type:complete